MSLLANDDDTGSTNSISVSGGEDRTDAKKGSGRDSSLARSIGSNGSSKQSSKDKRRGSARRSGARAATSAAGGNRRGGRRRGAHQADNDDGANEDKSRKMFV